jgi:DNA-binding transcriptional ArsR family regulator
MVIDTDTKRRIRLKELEEEEALLKEKELDERKNKNFVMFYCDHLDEAMWLFQKSGIASSIFAFIVKNMDNYNALVCSYKVIQERFKISSETVRVAIKLLRDNGFIDILKSGSNNVYVINPKIAWTSWENQKKYCKFDGKIIVAQSENEKFDPSAQFEKFKTLRTRENIKEFDFTKQSFK